MAARAIWKGLVKVGSASVPIKMYAAVQDRDIHFHVLQRTTKSRVKQEMVRENEEEVDVPRLRQDRGSTDVRTNMEIDFGHTTILFITSA